MEYLTNGCNNCLEYMSNYCIGYCKGGKVTFACEQCGKQADPDIKLLFPTRNTSDGHFNLEDFSFFCSNNCKCVFKEKHRDEISKKIKINYWKN